MSALERLAGHVRVDCEATSPITCDRPVVQGGVLAALLRETPLAAVPKQLAALFTLCGAAHERVATAALRAARGEVCRVEDAQWLETLCMREHVLRLGLDLPLQTQLAGVSSDARWLQGLPEVSLGSTEAIAQSRRALSTFCEERLWRMSAQVFCERFDRASALAELAAERATQPGPWAWLQRAAQLGAALPVALHALPAPHSETALTAIAIALASEAGFCARPSLRGVACETGPWSRILPAEQSAVVGDSLQSDAWQLTAARVLELARLCAGSQTLRHGALSLGPREAIAYVEMSRGLLVHWVKLRSCSDSTGAVADYRVLAPTEWNFHPEGALARAIRARRPDAEALRLLLQAFDPCVRVVIAPRGSLQPV